MSSGLFYC